MTTETLTLTDFLLARIAEDEYEANVCLDQYARGDGGSTPRWRRQLAECKAHRAIVEAHPIITGPRILTIDTSGTDFGCETCHCIDKLHEDGIVEALGYCDTLRALASIYADHEDYRAEWAL